jgi:hypothetical protein
MAKYRKKPVVIEAFQFGITEKVDLPRWAKDAIQSDNIQCFSQYGGSQRWAEINTLEGTMRAEVGDWVIRGVAGEIYPCKPDIFEKTYEQVE